MDGKAGLSREERLNRVMGLWSRVLSECAVSVIGARAPFVWREVGRIALELLSEEGVELLGGDPVETVNSIFSYFVENGYFEDAAVKSGKTGADTLEIYVKGGVDFSGLFIKPHEQGFDAQACFCYHVIRYALSSKFSLELKILASDIREDSGEVFIKARLLPASDGMFESGRLVNDVERLKNGAGDFKWAIDMSLDAIISVNESGSVILWNPAAEKMMGYSRKEAIGLPIETIVPPEYREKHREGFKRFFSTGKCAFIGKVVEVEGLRRDGTKFPAEMGLTAERSASGWAFTAVIRDISYRKSLEGRLKEKLGEMERLNKLMVGRELKMEELRAEIRALRSKAGGQNG